MMKVRSFAKEEAACDKYKGAVSGVLKYGLKSAAASGLFFGINFTFATGRFPSQQSIAGLLPTLPSESVAVLSAI